MNFGIWDILMMSGALQGAVMGVVIWLKPGKNTLAGRLIALIIFTCVLACVGTILDTHPQISIWGHRSLVERFIPFYLTLLVGPLIYFHLKSLLDPHFSIDRKASLHLLPILFNLIPPLLNTWQVLGPVVGGTQITNDRLGFIFHHFYIYGDAVFWIHLTVYLLKSLQLLKEQPVAGRTTYFSWLRGFVIVFLIFQFTWLPFLLVYISPYRHLIWEYGLFYYPIYIPLICLIYWIGIRWLIVASAERKKTAIDTLNLTEKAIQSILVQLASLMEEKSRFLDVDCNVNGIARELGTPPKTLSWILNHRLDTNFNDYINKYRVALVIEKMMDPKYDHFTIAALALDSGFQSIPTFQRAFKHCEGVSPNAYKKRMEIAIKS